LKDLTDLADVIEEVIQDANDEVINKENK